MYRKALLSAAVTMIFSSCITSFEAGQEAATLPKKDLAVGGNLGISKVAVNARYGLFNKLDIGASCNFNFIDRDNSSRRIFPEFSIDTKWQFFGKPPDHFVISSGLGFGTGVERTTIWNEIYNRSEDEAWYRYGGKSLDGYLPLYFSYYLVKENNYWSFNCNPYLVYRFGFYDEYTGLGPGDTFTGYRKLDQVFGGTAFSIGRGDRKNTLMGILNLLYPGPRSPNGLDGFEIYIV
jgi:hypothetical protein